MGPLVILIAQAGVASAAPPDIEIAAKAQVRSVEVRSGRAEVAVRADPGIAPPVAIERSAPAGQARYNNLKIGIRAIARLTAPDAIAAIDTQTGDNR